MSCEEWSLGNEVIYEVHGETEQAHVRHFETRLPEGFFHTDVVPRIRMRQKPGFVNQFRKIDCTTARPLAVQTRGDNQRIVEEIFQVQVGGCPIILKRLA